jgi:hypothetical protein
MRAILSTVARLFTLSRRRSGGDHRTVSARETYGVSSMYLAV